MLGKILNSISRLDTRTVVLLCAMFVAALFFIVTDAHAEDGPVVVEVRILATVVVWDGTEAALMFFPASGRCMMTIKDPKGGKHIKPAPCPADFNDFFGVMKPPDPPQQKQKLTGKEIQV